MRTLLKNCKLIQGLSNIIIENEKIIDIYSSRKERRLETTFDQIIDIKNNLVIPGMIDVHVHVRDLQQSDKEDWISASKAAILGGVTTIIDMPNTIPATTNFVNLNLKRKAAQKAKVNYKFHLGATENNLKELDEILKNNPSDIAGIKIFLAGSSSNEVVTDEDKLKDIFKLAKKYKKVVLVHTEMQDCLNKWQKIIEDKCIQNHDKLRNRECAIKGTELVLRLSNEIGNKLYICHISTKEEIELIKKHKNKNIFCEVTPHHLLLDESILAKIGNFGKVNPPLRSSEDNQALWEAILDGTIDCVGSDHAPHTIDEKIENYINAPSGFPGLETTLPVLITEFNERKIPIKRLVELTSTKPAEIFEYENRGKIKEGYFADLTVIDTEKESPIVAALFQSKAKYSPFDGIMVKAQIDTVFINGKKFEFNAECH